MTDWKPEEGRPEWLPDVDLVGVTRGRRHVGREVIETVHTTVWVELGGRPYRWIRCGLLTDVGDSKHWGRHIGARYEGATDREHDSAYAFRLEVVGLQLQYVSGGVQEFVGLLPGGRGSRDSFRVPGASQAGVRDIPGAIWCDRPECNVTLDPGHYATVDSPQRHLITRFTPEPIAEELWERLRGQMVRVTIAPADAIS